MHVKPRLLDVARTTQRSACTALGLAINDAQISSYSNCNRVIFIVAPTGRPTAHYKTVISQSYSVLCSLELIHTGTPHTTQTDRTVLSCLLWRCELSRPDRPTSAFSVGVCRVAQCDRRTHSDAERTCRADSIHTRHDTDRTVLLCLAGGVNWALVINYFGEAPSPAAPGSNCPPSAQLVTRLGCLYTVLFHHKCGSKKRIQKQNLTKLD